MLPRIYYYSANAGIHNKHPDSTRVTVRMISGGGGGMGSQANMVFNNTTNPIPYGLYGGIGGDSCWDTYAPLICCWDGSRLLWPNHPLKPSHPLFFTHDPTRIFYVVGVSGVPLDPNFVQLSYTPYIAPGVIPQVPVNLGGPVQFQVNAYRYIARGACGGGIIGDQAISNECIGAYSEAPYPRSFSLAGNCGELTWNGGGRGGDSPWGGGGAAQYGPIQGNAGNNMQGGGGSGGGDNGNSPNTPSDDYFGAGGGAGGNYFEIDCELKPTYHFRAGAGGAAGPAGPGGFAGGVGGNGVVIVKEYFPLPMD